MRATCYDTGYYCECEWLMIGDQELPDFYHPLLPVRIEWIECTNPTCVHHGKRFKKPTVELIEMK